jgi:6-pyruvoyltetrahydropterin/6-carboxytetrahydropterin synthase
MEHRLELDGWKTGIRFSSCHMLLRHDKCSRLHGHSYCIHLRIHGDINEDNMLLDFGKIKKYLRGIADEFDHMTLIPTENNDIRIKEVVEEDLISVDMNGKRYAFPNCDVKYLPIPTTTVEEMSKYLLCKLIDDFDFPSNIKKIELGVDEGVGQGAWASEIINGG